MRRRLIASLIASCALVATLLAARPAQANGNCVTYWGASGSGTVAHPYPVASQLDLEEVDFCPDKVFAQTADITLTGTWAPLGITRGAFTGTYDGNGFQISGLLTTDHNAFYVGLFGSIGTGAVIRDTHVSGSIIGAAYVGGLVGDADGATVLDSTAAVTISESTTRYEREYIGGLIGFASGTTIARSHGSGSISLPSVDYSYLGGLVGYADGSEISASSASGNVSGGSSVGGLAGVINGGSVSTSFATGAVSARGIAGGLAGRVSSGGPAPNALSDVYARGSVASTANTVGALIGQFESFGGTRARGYATGLTTGSAPTGGFLGAVLFSVSDASWTAGFWDTETTGQGAASGSGVPTGLTGQTTAQMTDITTYRAAGWNISNVAGSGATWGICPSINDGYPFLRAFYDVQPCTTPAQASRPATPPPPVYTLTLDANGGSCTVGTVSGDSGAWITLPSTGSCARRGFEFTGWSTDRDGRGIQISPGAQANLSSDNTLFAQWRVLASSEPTGSGSTEAPSTASPPVFQAVRITRNPMSPRVIIIRGTVSPVSTDTAVRIWFRTRGNPVYQASPLLAVNADGTFLWSHRSEQRLYAYVESGPTRTGRLSIPRLAG